MRTCERALVYGCVLVCVTSYVCAKVRVRVCVCLCVCVLALVCLCVCISVFECVFMRV